MPCAASVSGWSLGSSEGIACSQGAAQTQYACKRQTRQFRFGVAQAMSGNDARSRLLLAPIPARAHAGVEHPVIRCVCGIQVSTHAELLLIGFGLLAADFAVLGVPRRG